MYLSAQVAASRCFFYKTCTVMDTDAKGGNESSYFMIEKLMNKRRRRPSSKLLLNTFPLSPSYYSSVRPQGFRERAYIAWWCGASDAAEILNLGTQRKSPSPERSNLRAASMSWTIHFSLRRTHSVTYITCVAINIVRCLAYKVDARERDQEEKGERERADQRCRKKTDDPPPKEKEQDK